MFDFTKLLHENSVIGKKMKKVYDLVTYENSSLVTCVGIPNNFQNTQ